MISLVLCRWIKRISNYFNSIIKVVICSPDGETKFALTFVDAGTNMGTWVFSGNALAVHTMNLDGFTISYSVVAGQN